MCAITINGPTTRRDFLKAGAALAAIMGLGSAAVSSLADAAQEIASATAPVLWLQGLSCSGCTISLLNSDSPGPAEIITRYLSLGFHSTLSAATGQVGMDSIEAMITRAKGKYILVMEGAIPAGMPAACNIGGQDIGQLFLHAASGAKTVVAVGTCAAFGGVPSAQDNPTGAVSVPQFMSARHVTVPLVALPGCPAHPDWIVGTLAHLLKLGMPKVDEKRRPVAFFDRTIHAQCSRSHDYDNERFAHKFGDQGCLHELGCLGIRTIADCTLRQWNSGTNVCTRAGGGCIGCAAENFASRKDMPLFRKGNSKTA
jgi:hydrogenase small subunit